MVSRLLHNNFHPCGPADICAVLAAVYLVIVSLVAPPTPGWRLVRAAIVAPVSSAVLFWFSFYPVHPFNHQQWGMMMLVGGYFVIHTLELLVFFPAEDYNYRVLPRVRSRSDQPPRNASELSAGHFDPKVTIRGPGATRADQVEWTVEPVPAPWTWHKFWWASSAFWARRGIGWNSPPPLPDSPLRDPFAVGSSRRRYVWIRLRRYIIGWIIDDFLRAYINLSAASTFFSGRPGSPTYSDLTQWQRAIYSIVVVTKLVLSMDRTHVPIGMLLVSLGGIMGWESETSSPWGWPPLFGGFEELWKHPGLSRMWSRTWHHYFRIWLFKFGWVGLGEKVLGLPPSGPSLTGPPTIVGHSKPSSSQVPASSGRTSPAHPLPTTPSDKPPSVKVNNLIKSFCVFALTGWVHDQASYLLLYHTNPGIGKTEWKWTDGLATMPFFIVQPVGLAIEAAVKAHWRGWTSRRHAEWKNAEPSWLCLLERIVGFVWTWTWLGWTAGWFIQGLVSIGYYRRDAGGAQFPSLFGGLVWGMWRH